MDFSTSKKSKKTLPCISSLKFEDKISDIDTILENVVVDPKPAKSMDPCQCSMGDYPRPSIYDGSCQKVLKCSKKNFNEKRKAYCESLPQTKTCAGVTGATDDPEMAEGGSRLKCSDRAVGKGGDDDGPGDAAARLECEGSETVEEGGDSCEWIFQDTTPAGPEHLYAAKCVLVEIDNVDISDREEDIEYNLRPFCKRRDTYDKWMSNHQDKSMQELVMPASHDAGCSESTLQSAGSTSGFAVTQTKTIKDLSRYHHNFL